MASRQPFAREGSIRITSVFRVFLPEGPEGRKEEGDPGLGEPPQMQADANGEVKNERIRSRIV